MTVPKGGPDSATAGQAVLFAKMAKVLSEVERVPKNGRNSFHNYHYVTEADLVEALRGLLAKNGLCLFVGATNAEVRLVDAKGGPVTTVQMTATFCCTETGATYTVPWIGSGQDSGDKGLYKAYTGALKYLLMKTFLVSTGDDPEQDTRQQERTGTSFATAALPSVIFGNPGDFPMPFGKDGSKGQPIKPQVQAGPRRHPEPTAEASDFVMPFGSHKGEPLKAIPMGDLMSSLEWAKGKGKFKEFQLAAADWLETLVTPGGTPIGTRGAA